MIIQRKENGLQIVRNIIREVPYVVKVGQNGKKFVDWTTVCDYYIHITEGNSKVGDVLGWNLPIEYSCDHRCECYQLGMCYACSGCYQFAANQASYAENYKFYRYATDSEFLAALNMAIEVKRISNRIKKEKLERELANFDKKHADLPPELCDQMVAAIMERLAQLDQLLWRWFTIGDVPDSRFVGLANEAGIENPDVDFWSYTKKYAIVNRWLDKYIEFVHNLNILFSHWRNRDGTYFPMNNPHNLPTSEFIPLGEEHLAEQVTHICPCSDPNWKGTCSTCKHSCKGLKRGQSMALLEHSTQRTKERDRRIREMRSILKV